jgi:aldehyde:ferredoxin oxidoreductase
MNTEYGWAGNVLRVNLTQRHWTTEPTEKYAERFIGGVGIGLNIVWNELDQRVGAFDPDNKLIFAAGPLTGTLAPGSGRFELVAKSPRSYPKETVTRSGMGGYWGPELKYAGFDALVVEGRAESWVLLWIHDGIVEFVDARDYLGKDTYLTQQTLRRELHPEARTLCIGPAGEHLSRLAVILSDATFASGRSGFGAVMGSKQLKAIAVRGTKPIKIRDPQALIAASNKVRQLSSDNPMKELTTRALSSEALDHLNTYRKRNTGCFGCCMPCFAFLEIPGAGAAPAHCANYYYYGPATRFYGHTRERDQAVADGFVLANKLGLDTFEFARMLPFLEELQEIGNRTIRTELPYTIGSRQFIQGLLNNVAYRQGIGDLLAEGTARAADKIEGAWDLCAKYFPAHGAAEHGNLREHPGLALQWALDSRGPVVDQHSYIRLAVTFLKDPGPYRLSSEDAMLISEKVFDSPKAIDSSTFDLKPEAIAYVQDRSCVINTLVLCDWLYPATRDFSPGGLVGDTSLESRLLGAVTALRLSEDELNHVGERIWNLARAIMVTEGRTRNQDTLHESYFHKKGEQKPVVKADLEEAKTRYYRLRGWDEKTGCPTRATLERLGLSDVAERLESRKEPD